MHIAQINAVYGIMSTGRTALQTADYLIATGHKCITFYGEVPGQYDNACFMGNYLSHKIHAITSRLTGNAGCGSARATRKLLAHLDDFRPDVVHLRNLHGNFVHIPMLLDYLAQKDIPTVVSLHDCYFFTGGCMHYTANNCDKWLDGCQACKHLHRGTDYLLTNPAHRNLMQKKQLFNAIPHLAVCGVSKWTESEAHRSPVFTNAKIITHVYNWIDLDTFKPATPETNQQCRDKLGINNSTMVLGVASGWSEKKGLSDYKKLAALLPTVKFVLVGKMPDRIELPDNIITPGTTDNATQLAQLYSAADVFVHLSLEETFGKVTAEAIACGTPAVVYNSTASPELVDYNSGRIITPGDIDGVADAIADIIGGPDLSIHCRQRAIDHFDMHKNMQRQLNLYQEIIDTKI